ncbi:hypothetical protein CPB84DRAFT_1850245 [Gymnopilus junonius]|uniref:Uncharacterized protein n=1 Tax=Gymnopilus junonius TaxID=109634 RepID=A0A9P5NEM4_GYMJU|nr:hypothetical protein CPB84DRAFT_1850245 [Gymnopilus junonius]
MYIRNTLHGDLLQLWLRRSGKKSVLDLHIHAEHRIGEVAASMSDDPLHLRLDMKTSPSLVAQAWDLVVKEIHRWRRVQLVLDRHAVFRLLDLPLRNSTTPAVEHLSIQLDFRGDQPGIQILDALQHYNTPSPRSNFKLSWESMSLPSLAYHQHGLISEIFTLQWG